jgi:hypothetical protein
MEDRYAVLLTYREMDTLYRCLVADDSDEDILKSVRAAFVLAQIGEPFKGVSHP